MATTTTTLAVAMRASDLAAVLTSTTGTAPGNTLLIGGEYMIQTGASVGSTVPVRRGQNGSAQIAHAVNTSVTMGLPSDFAIVPPTQAGIYTDGTTLSGDGSSGSPLAAAVGGGTVVTSAPLTGVGSVGSPVTLPSGATITSPTLVTPALGAATADILTITSGDVYSASLQVVKDLTPGANPPSTTGNSYFKTTVEPTADQVAAQSYFSVFTELDLSGPFDVNNVVGTYNFVYLYPETGAVYATIHGALNEIYQDGDGGAVAAGYGTKSRITIAGTSNLTSGYAYDAQLSKSGGGTVTNYYAYYSSVLTTTLATNPYFLWYDGGGGDANAGGVFRVNHLGILAYYNPAFTAYTPGATNFERELIRWGDTGVFGTDNVAYIGVESGGTGTLRALNLLGAGVHLESVAGTSTYLGMAEIAAPSAPAANGVRIYAVDNGGGKTQLMALFSSGAAQQIAIQP